MEKVLAELLERLVVIAQTHPEVEGEAVEERFDDAVHHGFLIPTPGYRLPDTFDMDSPEGDRAVREVWEWFLPAATAAAASEGLDTFHKRLAAFQNLDVTVGPQRMCYNDFFGWTNPERYDEYGNVIPRGGKQAEQSAPADGPSTSL
jgi:hypothetical protein